MLIHPQFDPVALSLGPLSVHWYGLMYLLAFLQFWWLGRYRILNHPQLSQAGWTVRQLDDLLFYGVLGVVLGGRRGDAPLPDAHAWLAGDSHAEAKDELRAAASIASTTLA